MIDKQDMVVFDLDDVIAIMRYEFAKIIRDTRGIYIHPNHWWTISCTDLYGFGFPCEDMIEHNLLERCGVEADTVDVFDDLRSRGIATAIVTARKWHPKALDLTVDYFLENGFCPDKLYIVGNEGKSKALEDLTSLYNVIGFIDDQPKYIDQALNVRGVENVTVFNRPWNNAGHPNVPRVQSLTEFKKMVLESKGYL